MENINEQILTSTKKDPEPSPEDITSYEKEVNFLLQALEKRNAVALSWKAFEHEQLHIHTVEDALEKLSHSSKALEHILDRYNINLDIKRIGENLFVLQPSQKSLEGIDTLLDGKDYAYSGGVARAVLLRELGYDKEAMPRDVDIVRITTDNQFDTALSEIYMPDDAAKGHPIQPMGEDYFETRDFTMNELLLQNNKLYLTKACLLDTVRGIVRFSDFVKEERYEEDEDDYFETSTNSVNYFVKNKLIGKAVRFSAELTARGLRAEIANKEIFESQNIYAFHLALHLDRALERGSMVAQEYVHQLIELEQISSDITTPQELQDYLLTKTDFVFRFSAQGYYDTEESLVTEYENNVYDEYLKEDEKYDEYDKLPFQISMRKDE